LRRRRAGDPREQGTRPALPVALRRPPARALPRDQRPSRRARADREGGGGHGGGSADYAKGVP
jgi:hypothetical protein